MKRNGHMDWHPAVVVKTRLHSSHVEVRFDEDGKSLLVELRPRAFGVDSDSFEGFAWRNADTRTLMQRCAQLEREKGRLEHLQRSQAADATADGPAEWQRWAALETKAREKARHVLRQGPDAVAQSTVFARAFLRELKAEGNQASPRATAADATPEEAATPDERTCQVSGDGTVVFSAPPPRRSAPTAAATESSELQAPGRGQTSRMPQLPSLPATISNPGPQRGDAKLRALQSRRREYEERRLAESAALEPPSAEKRPHPYDFDEPAESTPPPLHKKPRSAALGEEPAAPHGEKRPRDEDDPAEIDRDAKKQHGQSTPASVAHVGQVSAIPGSFWI